MLIAFSKRHSINSGENLDFPWLSSDLDDEILGEKIFLCETNVSESKLPENSHKFPGIIRSNGHEKVDITRIPRESVQTYRISTDDEVSYLLTFE